MIPYKVEITTNFFHSISIFSLCFDVNFFIPSKSLSLKYSFTISLLNLSIFSPYIFSNKSYHISSFLAGFHLIPYNPATAYNLLHPISISLLCCTIKFFISSIFLSLKYSITISFVNSGFSIFLFLSIFTPYNFSNKSYQRSWLFAGSHLIPYNPATAYSFLHPISIFNLCLWVKLFISSRFLALKYASTSSFVNFIFDLLLSVPVVTWLWSETEIWNSFLFNSIPNFTKNSSGCS